MTDQETDFTTDPYDSIMQSFGTIGLHHQADTGAKVVESHDPGFDANRRSWMAARNSLAAIMMLRHIKRVAPELMAELVDVNMTANLLSEFGVMLKLDTYMREAGGSPEFVTLNIELAKQHEDVA